MSQIFYDIMKYPTPVSTTQFAWLEEDHLIHTIPSSTDRSREHEPSSIMSDYLDHILSYDRLYRCIPFVEHIYLCNSITFNGLHEGSDIDILIIAKPGMIRLARFRSLLLFSVIGLKRFGNNVDKKFCLSYYIDRDHCNLYHTSLQPYDIYLCYWIAHLVPLYSANTSHINEIYTSNRRITHFLPNIQLGQNISLGFDYIVGETAFKTIMEKICNPWPRVGRINIFIVKSLWLPILEYKTRALGEKGRGIIICDTMLKFYHDRRKRINYQYKQANNPYQKTETHEDESLF